MFVLLDMEWIEKGARKRELTQLAALRVDAAWTETDSFEAIIAPPGLEDLPPGHMALSGYPPERFAQGEQAADAIRRFSAWLQADDVLCVWHASAKDALSAFWLAVVQTPLPHPIFCANYKACRKLKKGSDLCSLYTAAELAGVPPEGPPHCSKSDAALMRTLFPALDLSQENLQAPPKKKAPPSPAKRTQSLLERTQYNYIFLPTSAVFHTKECPRIRQVKAFEGSVYYATAAKTRRPCKICKPQPNAKPVKTPPPKAKKKTPPRNPDRSQRVKVQLLGGTEVELRKDKVIGCCHNAIHPGKLTVSILYRHNCIAKQCPFLEKYEDTPFWISWRKRQAKRKKKAKKDLP